jgi:hypothetical protein
LFIYDAVCFLNLYIAFLLIIYCLPSVDIFINLDLILYYIMHIVYICDDANSHSKLDKSIIRNAINELGCNFTIIVSKNNNHIEIPNKLMSQTDINVEV